MKSKIHQTKNPAPTANEASHHEDGSDDQHSSLRPQKMLLSDLSAI